MLVFQDRSQDTKSTLCAVKLTDWRQRVCSSGVYKRSQFNLNSIAFKQDDTRKHGIFIFICHKLVGILSFFRIRATTRMLCACKHSSWSFMTTNTQSQKIFIVGRTRCQFWFVNKMLVSFAPEYELKWRRRLPSQRPLFRTLSQRLLKEWNHWMFFKRDVGTISSRVCADITRNLTPDQADHEHDVSVT